MHWWTRREGRCNLGRGLGGESVGGDGGLRRLERCRPAVTNQGRAGRDRSRSHKARGGYVGNWSWGIDGRRRQRQMVHLNDGWGRALVHGRPDGLLGRHIRRTKRPAGIGNTRVVIVVVAADAAADGPGCVMMGLIVVRVREKSERICGVEDDRVERRRRSGRGTAAGHPSAVGWGETVHRIGRHYNDGCFIKESERVKRF